MNDSDAAIPQKHLRACPDHRVVREYNGETWCPCCELDIESRPGAVSGESFTDRDLRWQLGRSMLEDLVPRLIEHADEQDVGPVYVAVAELSETQIRNAAGYTRQERWFNVVVAETGTHSREIISQKREAREILETLENGGTVLEPSEAPRSALEPDEWEAVVGPEVRDVEYERVDEDTLRIKMDGFRSDNHYSKVRRNIGVISESFDLSVRTVEAGGRFETGIVEVSIE